MTHRRSRLDRGPTFAAIDFETANNERSSVCALAVVRVHRGRVVRRFSSLVRPPTRTFRFTRIHGIRWEDVCDAPRFPVAWARAARLLKGVDFIAAHNVGFDRSVLMRSCERFGVAPPDLPFECSLKLARRTWDLQNHRLPAVAEHLGIPLNHHHAASDAEACAQIVLRASKLLARA